MDKPRVLIESPFGRNPDGSRCLPAEYRRNTRYACRAIKDSLKRGEAPFAPHVLYPLVLNDIDDEERQMGMEAGFAWGEVAEFVAVYDDLGITAGMRVGIDRWRRLGLPIIHRDIGVKE